MNIASVRAVIITRPDGTEIEYTSQSAAARAEGLMQSPISEMCRGVRKAIKGYKARWKEAPPPPRTLARLMTIAD